MTFPEWAPKELVEYYKQLKVSGNPTFENDIEIINRLLTRPEMEKVWDWFNNQNMVLSLTANGGVVGRFLMRVDQWEAFEKSTVSDRKNDFKEMAGLAKKLSVKLKKYRNEYYAFNRYAPFIPEENHKQILHMLAPDWLKSIRERNYPNNHFPYWDYILPPIDEILASLAINIKDSEPRLNVVFPTKIKQITAFRTYLINSFYRDTQCFVESLPPSIAAIFIGVALDDEGVTERGVVQAWDDLRKKTE